MAFRKPTRHTSSNVAIYLFPLAVCQPDRIVKLLHRPLSLLSPRLFTTFTHLSPYHHSTAFRHAHHFYLKHACHRGCYLDLVKVKQTRIVSQLYPPHARPKPVCTLVSSTIHVFTNSVFKSTPMDIVVGTHQQCSAFIHQEKVQRIYVVQHPTLLTDYFVCWRLRQRRSSPTPVVPCRPRRCSDYVLLLLWLLGQ